MFWNFISTVTRDDYYDYISKAWNKSENVYRNYKVFSSSKVPHRSEKYLNQLSCIMLINLVIQWGHV